MGSSIKRIVWLHARHTKHFKQTEKRREGAHWDVISEQEWPHSFKQEKANSSCALVMCIRKAITVQAMYGEERGQGAGHISLGRWDQNQGNVI